MSNDPNQYQLQRKKRFYSNVYHGVKIVVLMILSVVGFGIFWMLAAKLTMWEMDSEITEVRKAAAESVIRHLESPSTAVVDRSSIKSAAHRDYPNTWLVSGEVINGEAGAENNSGRKRTRWIAIVHKSKTEIYPVQIIVDDKMIYSKIYEFEAEMQK